MTSVTTLPLQPIRQETTCTMQPAGVVLQRNIAHRREQSLRMFDLSGASANQIVSDIRVACLKLTAVLLLVCTVPLTASAGTIQDFHYASQALGRDQVAQVYIPDGAAPPGGWPVLYLLHGLDGASTDWQTLGRIQSIMDREIAEHQIQPFVVVMPPGNNSWYVDSADVSGPGNYATATAHDLPAAIEEAFPVGEDRAHRAIAGLSMGGFGALRLGLQETDRYLAIAAMSPAIWQNVPTELLDKPQAELDRTRAGSYFRPADPDDVTVGLDLPPDGRHFGKAFGTPFNPRRFNAENVFTLLQNAIEAHKKLPSIFLTVGDDDSHLLWRGAIAFFETMQMDHRDMEFRVTDGDHNWNCWRSSLMDAITFVDAQFRRRPAEKDALR